MKKIFYSLLFLVIITVVLAVSINLVLAGDDKTYLAWHGQLGSSATTLRIAISNISTSCAAGNLFFDHTYTNEVDSNYIFDIMLGETYTLGAKNFSKCGKYGVCMWADDVLVTGSPFSTTGTGYECANTTIKSSGIHWLNQMLDVILDTIYGSVVTQLNLTTTTYTGRLINGSYYGYIAGNKICNMTYSNTHLCNEFEIIEFITNNDFTHLGTSDAWASAGGPKYVPANIPVNDCKGWTYDGTTSYLGNYWKFNNTGGRGAAINCATTIPLACCG